MWTPDGQRIGFYSDRSGGYEIWTIRPDGSGLEPVTRASTASMNFPVWSPDGTRFATSTIPGNWMLFERGAGTGPPRGTTMPPPAESKFWPLSWSPDGKRLAGIVVGGDGLTRGVGLFSFESQRYDVKPGMSSFLQWIMPLWLSDSRRLLVRHPRGISVVDTATWRSKRLVEVGGYMIGRSVGISRDDRFITWTETATEGDIWLVNLQ